MYIHLRFSSSAVIVISMGIFIASSTMVLAATFNVTDVAGFQTAMTTSQANGENDTINVAAGTYNISSTLQYNSSQNNSLDIVGAGTTATILDGGNSVQIMKLIAEGSGSISISGLTFRNGRNGTPGGIGGALFVNNSPDGGITIDQCVVTSSSSTTITGGAWLGAVNGDITVINSSFTYNTCDEGTSDDGAGLYLYFDGVQAAGSAIVLNNTISHNTLNDNPTPIGNCDGAGLMIYHLGTSGAPVTIRVENNIISDNRSWHGVSGAVLRNYHRQSEIVLSGNIFSGNISGGTPHSTEIPGGATHLYTDGGNVTISHNKYLNNRLLGPYDRGAGICIDNLPEGTLNMVANVFAGNHCANNGGGAAVNLGSGVTGAYIVENLFVNNQAGTDSGSGGGLSLNAQCNVGLINNTFYGNTASGGAGMAYYATDIANVASLCNEIYWNNTPDSVIQFDQGQVRATYSNIQNGTGNPYFGIGCIDSNPLFSDASNPAGADNVYATADDGMHLTSASSCIDSGSTNAVPLSVLTDIAGSDRIQNEHVDMGAYEGDPAKIFPGDVNGDRTVDLKDAILSLQVSVGYPFSARLEADVNADDKIGQEESVYILQSVGDIR